VAHFPREPFFESPLPLRRLTSVTAAHVEESGSLSEWLPVRCEPKYCDPYGRTVAVCWLDGKDIGEGMVDAGWAIDWPYYSSGRYRVMQRIRANTGEVFGKMADYQAFGCSVAW